MLYEKNSPSSPIFLRAQSATKLISSCSDNFLRLSDASSIHSWTPGLRSEGIRRCLLFCCTSRFRFAKSFFVKVSSKFIISLTSFSRVFSSIFLSSFVSFSKAFQISFLSCCSILTHCNQSLIFLSSDFASSTVIFFSAKFSWIGDKSSLIFSKI
jgi:hypothetical protein